MELESWEARDYTPEQVSLIMTLVNQAAVALENTRLFEQTQARAEEMAILNEMSRELSSLREIDTVIESVHRHSSLLIDATNFYIALYDAELDELSFPYYAEGEQVRRAGRRRAGKGMPEHVIRTRVPLLIKENVAVWLAGQGVDQIGQSAESWLGVPMMVGGQVIGVLAVQSYTTPRLYTENHRELLISIASQAAIAIQNARLFEQTQTARAQAQARARREQILRQIIVRVSASTDPDTIMRATVRELGTALGRPAFVRLGSAEELRTPNSQLAIQNSEGGE
jgi:GAF domain-containing protein